MSTAAPNVTPFPAPGWSSIIEAERSCRALGMSPVPSVFRDKRPLCKSHPALSVKQMSDAEIRAVVGSTGYRYGLGIVGGFGGWFAGDIDIDTAGIGPELVRQFLGLELGTVLGNPEHVGKLLFRGPYAEPDDALKNAANNYFTAGLAFTRAERLLTEAKQTDPASGMAAEREQVCKAAADAHGKAQSAFGRLRNAWIDQNKLIPSATAERKDAAGRVTLRIEIKSVGSIIVMPPSRHKLDGVSFAWDGGAPPQPFIAEHARRIKAEAVAALLEKVGGAAVKFYVNGATLVPQEIHDGARDKTLIGVGGSLRRKGLDAEEIEPALQAINSGRCCPPLPEKQVTKIANSAGRYPAGKLDDGKDKKQGAAGILLEIASGARLYHAPDGTGFADVAVGDHVETWAVASRGFKSWLRHAYYQQTGGAPTSEAMQAAMGVIEARCQFDGAEQQAHLRVAAHGGRHYVDLCDAAWRAVEIDASGWRIVDSGRLPVRFHRSKGALPLPEPVRGGSVAELRPFLNVSDTDFVLCVAWILASLRGEGERPVLVLSGEQGSAKSTTADMLRRLTDPSTAQLRALPRTLWDLHVAAMNAHVLVFDNLSGLPVDVSDALCRLSTGGGFSARQLYSDDSEVLFSGQRAVILTGIEDIATRPDLIDRTMMPALDAIPDDRRRGAAELWATFDAAAPCILGALLDVVSHGLRMLPSTRLDRLPRMADFAKWMAACETAMWPAGTFARVYADDVAGAMLKALGTEPAIVALRRYLRESPNWNGTADDLWNALGNQVDPSTRRTRAWPATPRALSGLLNRFAPALNRVGIIIERERTAAERQMHIMNLLAIAPVQPTVPQ